jgi:tetratricopeptide (TPR) repeat protein
MRTSFALTGLALVLWCLPLMAADPNPKTLCRKKIPQLKQQLSKNPADSKAWLELRTCANELKEWNDAVDAAMAAKGKTPNNPQPRIILGMAQMQGKDYDRAIEHFDKAIEINSQEPYAYFQMGMAYLFLNQPDKALTAAERAVELDPSNGSYQRQAAYTYMMLDDLPKAETAANAALKIDSDDIAAHKILARVYAKEEKTDESAREAQAAKIATAKHIASMPAPEPPPPGARAHEVEPEKKKVEKEDDADIIAEMLDGWEHMKADVIAGKLNDAIPYFSTYIDTRDKYHTAFSRMGSRAAKAMQSFGELYDCEVVLYSASCKALVRNELGTMHQTVVWFERNPDRIWRIKSF